MATIVINVDDFSGLDDQMHVTLPNPGQVVHDMTSVTIEGPLRAGHGMFPSPALQLLVSLAIASLVMACTGTTSGNRERFRVDTTESGRVDVTNTGVSLWEEGSGWHLEEDLRLGKAAETGPELFGQIGALLSDSKGRIYVLDIMSQEIRVFDSDGSWSHTIGRKGAGPGEFRGATGMALGQGDTLWVVDPTMDRYSAFTAEGRLVGTYPRRIQGYLDSWHGAFLSDGRYMDWGLLFPEEGAGVAGPRILLQPVTLSEGFQVRDSFPPLEFTQEMAVIAGQPRPMPFYNDGLVFNVDAAGNIWFARSREYRIYRRNLAGDTTLSFTLPAQAVSLTDADRAYVRRRLSGRPGLLDDYLSALPKAKPILHAILVDGVGHLFVIVNVEGEDEGSILDVFRDTGEYLGRLHLPRPVTLVPANRLVAHVTKDHLLLVVTDETEVPYVSRLRLVKPR